MATAVTGLRDSNDTSKWIDFDSNRCLILLTIAYRFRRADGLQITGLRLLRFTLIATVIVHNSDAISSLTLSGGDTPDIRRV